MILALGLFNMVMLNKRGQMLPGRGTWVKIPLLLENVAKRSVNNLWTD